MCLVGITDFYGFAYFEGSLIDTFLSHDHLEERGLAGAVRTDDANDAVRWKNEVEIVKQQLVAEGFRYMISGSCLSIIVRMVNGVQAA